MHLAPPFGGPADRYKQAAIECWTADPCGASTVEGELGTRPYFERLLDARARYAPWLATALGYAETAGKRVLDVGCGQGIDLAQFARAGARAIGIDLTPRHVALARAHLAALALPAEAAIADAERLPFADGSFDWVSSNGVLHHTPAIADALSDIRRVLRPGGEARIILYNRNSFHYWVGQVLARGIIGGRLLHGDSIDALLSDGVEHSRIGARPLVRVYAPGRVRDLLRAAGFRRVGIEIRHLGSPRLAVALERLLGERRSNSLARRLGDVAGWYVVARGVV